VANSQKRRYPSFSLFQRVYAVVQAGQQVRMHVRDQGLSRGKTFLFQPAQHLYLQNGFGVATGVFSVIPIPVTSPVADGHGVKERGDIGKFVDAYNALQVMKELFL